MTDASVLAALRATLEADPRNGVLWLHYADLARGAGQLEQALQALRTAIEIESVRRRALLALLPLLRESGELSEALVRCEAALEREDDPELRAELERIEAARSGAAAPQPEADATVPPVPPVLSKSAEGDRAELRDDWADQFDWGDLRVTFDDVAGLADVKRQIHLRIIAPYKDPEVYAAFGRDAGGGLLLYGPPGCGKTFIARATAGELGARFCAVSIHEVLDKYHGETEKAVHGIFERARRESPAVLFFDEFDALGASRGRGESQYWRSLVNAILAEMDGIGGRNRDVLVCAATNLPWNVDVAFRRPGRFDRLLFVPPPDADARRTILERRLSKLPGGPGLDVKRWVRPTELFSGADLESLCERASEGAIDRSLARHEVSAVTQADLDAAAKATRSSIEEWFATARNYARYSNEGGQFDELAAYLRAAKRW